MSRHARLIATGFALIIALLVVSCSPAATPTTAPPPPPTVAPTSPPAAAPTNTSAPAPTATSAPATAGLQPCATGGLTVSSLQTPVPVTPAPTLAPTIAPTLNPNAPTAPPPAPTATLRPAPTADRVGFPDDYLNKFKFFYVYDRQDVKSITYVCANDAATAVKAGQPFPFGSYLVFESWRPREDASGNVVKDANGHLIRERLNAIFTMRKEQGFGEAYEKFRTGEWEYVAYRPDKSFQTPPQGSGTCAACHVAAGKERDWVFRGELFFAKDHYAQAPLPGPNEVSINRMNFFSNPLTVKVGTTVKWTNSAVDKIEHTVTASDKSFDSGTLKPGDSFSQTFAKAGTYNYVCSLHPDQMRARIEVKE